MCEVVSCCSGSLLLTLVSAIAALFSGYEVRKWVHFSRYLRERQNELRPKYVNKVQKNAAK